MGQGLASERKNLADVGSWLDAHARHRPSDTAFVYLKDGGDEAQRWSYAELDQRARRIAAWLVSQGRPGDRVLLAHAPGPDMVPAFFGCLYAGMVAVPAYPPRRTHHGDRLLAILEDSGAELALGDAAGAAALRALQAKDVRWARLNWMQTDPSTVAPLEPGACRRASADDLAFLQYTSGSTGDPKGVMVSHGNLLHNVRLMKRAFSFKPDSVMVSWLPLFHDMGLILGLLEPLYAGVPTVLMPPNAFLQAPLKWLQAISRWKGTHTAAPNFAYELCADRAAEASGLDLSAWRCAVNGAEPVRRETLERFQAAFEPYGLRRGVLCPSYGLAEGTLYVSGGAGVAGAGPEVASGRPFGQRVLLVDPASGVPCGPEGQGEIWVQGPSVAKGYWGREAATAEVFEAEAVGRSGHWLRTGDLGRFDNGALIIHGRLKDLIILRGVNHYPQDIEATAQSVSADLRSGSGAAFTVGDEAHGRVVLVQELVRHPSQPLAALAEAIVQAVAQEHGVRLQSVRLVAAATVGRTSSGKIQRRACKQAFLDGQLELLHAYDDAAAPSAAAAGAAAPGQLAWALQRLHAMAPGQPLLDGSAPLSAWGLDSLRVAEFRAALEARLGCTLPSAAETDDLPLNAWIDSVPQAGLLAPAPMAAAKGPWPLGPALASLWTAQALDPGSSAYHIAWCLRLEGALDSRRLQAALRSLTAAQTALRCAFTPTADGEVQMTDQGTGVQLQQPFDQPVALATARQWALAWSQAPFDAAKAPLWRAAGVRLDDGGTFLAFSVHHLVFDQRSWAVFHQQLDQAYSGAALAPDLERPLGTDLPSPLERRNAQSYWSRRLKSYAAQARPAATAGPGGPAAVEGMIDAGQVRALRALATAQRATLFTAVAAAWAEALCRFHQVQEACFAVPMTLRERPLSEGQVGYGVHPMPILLGASPALDPAARVRQASAAIREAMAQRGLSLAEAMRCAGLPSPAAYLVYQGQVEPPARCFGLPAQLWPLGNAHAKADLALELSGEDAWQLKLEYHSGRVSAAEAAELLQGFIQACARLSGSSAGPAERASSLRGELPEPSVDRTVIEGFHAQVSADAQADALVWQGGRMDRGTLAGQARSVARYLHGQGVRPGDRVAVHSRATAAWVAGLLGCFEAEAVYVPLDPAYPVERLRSMLQQAGCKAALSEQAKPQWAPADLAWGDLAQACTAQPAYLREPGRPRPQDPAYVIFTSGSSGRPKGVQVPHGALANHARAFASALALGPQDRVLQFVSISFDPSLEEVLPALVCGASVALGARSGAPSLQQLCQWIDSMGVSVLHLPAAYWHACMQAGGARALASCGSLRLLVTGGEAPDARAVRDLIEASEGRIAFANAYGPTEACITATLWQWHPGQPLGDPLPLGRPLAGVEAVVVDPEGKAAPQGASGELWLGGSGLADGHLGAEGLMQTAFCMAAPDGGPARRYYRTGDRALVDAQGQLVYAGRMDRQVKAAGVRLDLEELESLLGRAPGVAAAVVEASGSGEDLLLRAWVSPREGKSLAVQELKAWLAEHVPAACVPREIAVLAQLPITANGKVDRAALAKGGAPVQAPITAPKPETADGDGPLANLLVQAWVLALGRQDLGLDADFFALGGSSLRAVRLAAEASRLSGQEIGVEQVFQCPTPRRLAASLLGRVDAPQAVRLLAGQGGVPWVLLPPVSGRSICYQGLADRLGDDAAVFGVDLHALGEPARTWEACVDACARAVAETVKEEELCLGGWSMGGLLAVDVARQLRTMGRKVKRLALLDAVLPDALTGAVLLEDEDAMDEIFERDLEGLRRGDAGGTDAALESGAREHFRRYASILGQFRAAPFDIPLSLVLSEKTSKDELRSGFLGWALLARAGMTTMLVPGDHYSVVSGPALKRVARRLSEDATLGFEQGVRHAAAV